MKAEYQAQKKRQFRQVIIGSVGALVIMVLGRYFDLVQDNTVGLIVFWCALWVWFMTKTRIKIPCASCTSDLSRVIAQAETEELKLVACPFCGNNI